MLFCADAVIWKFSGITPETFETQELDVNNLYVTRLYASSETDVAGFAQLKKEASISEITF